MKTFKVQSFILISIGFILGMSEFIIVGIINDLANSFHVASQQLDFWSHYLPLSTQLQRLFCQCWSGSIDLIG